MWKRTSPARWLSICVLALAIGFVASTIWTRKVAQQIDMYANSITANGAVGVVQLANVTDDIRQISRTALLARRDSLDDDRARIESFRADLDQAMAAYRRTEDYPGERELFQSAERKFAPFEVAVDDVVNSIRRSPAEHAAAIQRLSDSSDALAVSIRDLTRFNADHVAQEGAAITEARQRGSEIAYEFRVITVALAVAGILLSWATSKQHIALVEKSKSVAEERANELEMFAGRVAHDLRAPLTVIEMNSVAAKRCTPETQKVAFERIARQGRRMGEMIDALLAFAQAGARPQPGTCGNIAEVVREVAADCQSAAKDADVELAIEPLPPAIVACSPSVLSIIVSNLVRNAIKYIGEDSDVRRVTVRMRERDRSLQFEVEDTGPGLPRGAEDRVFEPFVRVSGRTGGIGLGLATVKRLVEGHGGKVSVHSIPGRGCRFRFELPRAPGSPSPDSDPHPSLPNLSPTAPSSARL